jgi:hypothetical protein
MEGSKNKMARLVRSCLLFAALAAAPVAVSAASSGAPAGTCAAAGASATSPGDIDYASINQQLLQPEATLRITGLQAEIRRLDASRAPEAGLVRHRLLYALAQSQASLGMTTAAAANLKKLPANSPQAPEALILLAEMEVKAGRNKAAVRWLRQLADLYPDEPITIQALWRAAELNHPSSRQALALWQQAARQADQALALAQDWHARSQQPGFIDTVASDKLPPELWRLARSTFMDPAFASADAAQSEARRQLQCMAAGQGGALRRMDSGSLVADLNSRVGSSRSTMHALLRQRLEAAVQDWQNLSAEAHFRLADAQEPRVHPGLRPAD